METPHPGPLLGLLLLLLAASVFFTCARTVLFSLNRYRLRHRARQGHQAAARLNALLDQPQRLSATLRIGNICSTVGASVVATLLALRHGGDATLAISPFILTLATLMLAHPLGRMLAALPAPLFAYPASQALSLANTLLAPLSTPLLACARMLRTLSGGSRLAAERDDSLNEEELRSTLLAGDPQLPPERRAMLLGILDLDRITVDDIMIPRHEVGGIDLQSESSGLAEQIGNASHTRLPVFRHDINQVEGIVHMRRIAALLSRAELNEATLLAACDEPYFVPQGTSLAVQLINFQQHKRRTGIVVDEYGEVMGIVTLEDILEEIVGDLSAVETAHPSEIHAQPDGTQIIEGSAYLREVNKALGWNLPCAGPKTINGLVTEILESIPDNAVCLQVGRYRLEILHAAENRVAKVRAWECPADRDDR
ncbi:HlyC/CorC family transporter [Phytopseudomonas dryadis]|uniref:Magnesium/cobalt efflux protein n=1 Tax=Phytopseudomonas dryadis TaxID=2487520 RepID=A0A4Q9QY79_9GAMM|nr:CNNM domain-containing protein [Pseudomonas dryadis]TBU89767.1 magnesium/cobalt efflux protein [Pseudomonas dryadis]